MSKSQEAYQKKKIPLNLVERDFYNLEYLLFNLVPGIL